MKIESQQPELAKLIQKPISTSLDQSVGDALTQALEAIPSPQTEATPIKKKVNFAQFIRESPLGGTGIEFERIKDYPKPIKL